MSIARALQNRKLMGKRLNAIFEKNKRDFINNHYYCIYHNANDIYDRIKSITNLALLKNFENYIVDKFSDLINFNIFFKYLDNREREINNKNIQY